MTDKEDVEHCSKCGQTIPKPVEDMTTEEIDAILNEVRRIVCPVTPEERVRRKAEKAKAMGWVK